MLFRKVTKFVRNILVAVNAVVIVVMCACAYAGHASPEYHPWLELLVLAFPVPLTLNLLFVSTDIPLDKGVSVTDVKISMDGQTKYTFDEAYQSPDEQTYVMPMAINIWNDDLGKQDGLFGYIMPSSSIEVTFTISGLGSAEAAEEAPAEAEEEAAPAEEEAPAETEAAAEEAPAEEAAPAETEAPAE